MRHMEPAITVLFIHHSNDLYGADVMLLETLDRLDSARYRPLVVLPEDTRSEGGLSAALKERGIEQLWMPMAILRRRYLKRRYVLQYAYDFVKAALSIRKLIQVRRISLVHSNTLAVMAGALGARLSGVAHVWHVHEIIRRPKWFRRLLHAACTRLPDVTLCISNSVRANILADEPWADSKLQVIYNGLYLERFLPTQSQSEYRAELNLPLGVPIVGMVGRINQWKGQGILVDSAALLLRRFPDAVFLIVGSVFAQENHHLVRLKEKIAKYKIADSVLILNFRSDVAALFAAMDVYVHLSVEPEPFGLSIIEAMASGLPVVATAPGGPGEIIEDAVTGILVLPSAPEATVKALDDLLSNPAKRKTMAVAARERAFRLFHVNRYAAEIQNLYHRLLEARR